MLSLSLISILLLLLLSTALSMPPKRHDADDVAADATGRNAHRARTTTSSRPRRRSAQAKEKEEMYEILPSSAILERLQALVADYPAFATLTTTQEWFGVPRAGNNGDCPFDENYKVSGKGCNTYVLILQDKEAYAEDPDVQLAEDAERYLNLEEGWSQNNDGGEERGGRSGWKHVPDVFLSGAVHGNERVGPTSLLEAAELLAEAAHCESLPRTRRKPRNSTLTIEGGATEWEEELKAALGCRRALESKGVPARHRRWLARLVSSRRTIIVPTANALGYSRNQREEDGIDPNRDFPFDILPQEKDKCMQTTAGRSINELFRSHLFPVGLTFHGGMEVIAYEWGAPTYEHNDAPDAVAQEAVAGAYSRYANGFPGHKAYDFGTMNDKVYYVRGGMEDWAFAGSWDPDRVVDCAPKTFGGYPAEKTRYNNATLRAFNMLVETSNPKTPARKDLGKRTNPLESNGRGDNGHIARNIRLALLAIDIVEPYVGVRMVGGLELEDDVVPGVNLRRYDGKSYFDNNEIFWVPGGSMGGVGDGAGAGGDNSGGGTANPSVGIEVSWTVGGAFDIDETELIYGPWDALSSNLADTNDGSYPSAQTLALIRDSGEFTALPASNADMGRSRWHSEGPYPNSPSSGVGPAFEATINVAVYPPGTRLFVVARAKVDKHWLEPISEKVGPKDLGPVSHMVNARANPDYFATNAGKVIRGREDDWWYSAPITLVVGGREGEEAQVAREAEANHAPISYVFNAAGRDTVRAAHVNARLGYLPHVMDTVVTRPRDVDDDFDRGSGGGAPTTHSMLFLLGSLAVGMSFLLIAVGLLRRRQKRLMYARQRHERISEAEEDGFSVGSSYSDYPDEDNDVEVTSLGGVYAEDIEEESKEK